MQYTTVLDASDKSFESIIQNAMAFEDSKILAAILSRDYEENDVYLFCTDLKLAPQDWRKNTWRSKNFPRFSINSTPQTTTSVSIQPLL